MIASELDFKSVSLQSLSAQHFSYLAAGVLTKQIVLHRLAAEVERLQPLAERSADLEARLEAYQEEIAVTRSSAASPDEVRKTLHPVSPDRLC